MPNSAWILNTGVTDQLTLHNHQFIQYIRSNGSRRFVTAGSGALPVAGMGDIKVAGLGVI